LQNYLWLYNLFIINKKEKMHILVTNDDGFMRQACWRWRRNCASWVKSPFLRPITTGRRRARKNAQPPVARQTSPVGGLE
jgi:hypothetical protein